MIKITTASTTTTIINSTALFNGTTTSSCPPNPFENTVTGLVITHISLVISLVGIPVNVLTLIVLRRNSIRNATNLLLAVLATEDILIIMSYSLYYVAIHYFENYHITYLGFLRYADSLLYFALNWVKVAEIYTIVLLSLQRYFAIRWPLHAASLCSLGKTKRLLVAVVCVSALLKLPNLILGYRVMVYDSGCHQYMLKEVFGDEPWYTHFKLVHGQVLDQVFSYLIPLVVLIVLNIALIVRVRKATRQRLQEDGLGLASSSHMAAEHVRKLRIKCSAHHSVDNGRNQPPSIPVEGWSSGKSTEYPVTRFSSVCRTGGPSHTSAFTHSGSTQSRSVTLTLIGVVSTFIVFETPTTVCFCYEFWQLITVQLGFWQTEPSLDLLPANETQPDAQEWGFYHYAYPAALTCVLIGCASNFFIYMLIGSKFRRLCLRLLREYCRPRCWHTVETDGSPKTRWSSKRPIRRRCVNERSTEVTQTLRLTEAAYPCNQRTLTSSVKDGQVLSTGVV